MTGQTITLAQAQSIAQGVLARGRELNSKPLTAAVLDTGGHLLALLRDDGSSNMRPQIAVAKASGALGLGVSSRKIAQMAQERPSFIASVSEFVVGGLVPAAGGILLKSSTGAVIGAVGVTGDTSDRDEECALHAVAAAGLLAAGD